MRVAVPLFGDEVSPRFGCSTQLLVVVIEDGQVQSEEVRDIRAIAPWALPEFFASLSVEKLICGGVHQRHQMEMQRRGIEVIWGVIGPASEAVSALIAGTLRRDQFVCGPGGGGRGRRGRRGRRGGQGRGGGWGRGGGEI